MQCTQPTFDPRVRIKVSSCDPAYWNSTEWMGVKRKYVSNVWVSDMSVSCFWPCGAETEFVREYVPTTYLAFSFLSLICVVYSKRISNSRTVWITIATLLCVAFSFALLSYVASSFRSDASKSGANAAWLFMGAVASAQMAAAYAWRNVFWIEEYGSWIFTYAFTFASIGFAFACGFVPLELDARVRTVFETLICISASYVVAYLVPSLLVSATASALAMYIKLNWIDRDLDIEWQKMGEAYTREQVQQLLKTPEFSKWMSRNHMRLRKLR
jgi:hypothetical protein